MSTTIINKEDLLSYHFTKQEVLDTPEKIMERKKLLIESMILGNNFKTKVHLVCQTREGVIEFDATVWAVTNNYVEFKSGNVMPIQCILEVVK